MNKPTFKSSSGRVNPILVGDREYNACSRGPRKFHDLKQIDYGKGYKQGTFGDQLTLAHGAYLNQDNPDAQSIVGIFGSRIISGNTAMSYTPELIIVQDMPEVRDGRIVMDKKSLTSKLSKNAKKGVRFSDDGSIRAIQYGFAREWQNSDQMRINPFSIALTGNVNAPEMLAEIQDKIGKRGYIWALGKVSQSEIRVPVLFEFGDRLVLSGSNWDEFLGNWCSFGVRQ